MHARLECHTHGGDTTVAYLVVVGHNGDLHRVVEVDDLLPKLWPHVPLQDLQADVLEFANVPRPGTGGRRAAIVCRRQALDWTHGGEEKCSKCMNVRTKARRSCVIALADRR